MPPLRHSLERGVHHLRGLRRLGLVLPRRGNARHQELERAGGRELRRAAEAPEVGVELRGEAALGLLQHGRAEDCSSEARSSAVALRPWTRARRRRADLVAARAPCLRDALEHLPEARHAVARLGREVGAAVERHALRVHEDVQRPAALAGHRLHRPHVDRVDVRALLAVHLDRNEVLVHERGGLRVLERLVLHHVAPVAGRVADRDQHRLVLGFRASEGLLAPRIPVDGVVLVLQEVGAGLVGEAVGHGSYRFPIRSEANASNASR